MENRNSETHKQDLEKKLKNGRVELGDNYYCVNIGKNGQKDPSFMHKRLKN